MPQGYQFHTFKRFGHSLIQTDSATWRHAHASTMKLFADIVLPGQFTRRRNTAALSSGLPKQFISVAPDKSRQAKAARSRHRQAKAATANQGGPRFFRAIPA
jgi:hypothetical protein